MSSTHRTQRANWFNTRRSVPVKICRRSFRRSSQEGVFSRGGVLGSGGGRISRTSVAGTLGALGTGILMRCRYGTNGITLAIGRRRKCVTAFGGRVPGLADLYIRPHGCGGFEARKDREQENMLGALRQKSGNCFRTMRLFGEWCLFQGMFDRGAGFMENGNGR